MKVFIMKPVTARDVVRLCVGLVTDADERDHIFHALAADPDLERLFLLLTDDPDDESPEQAAWLDDATEFQALLERSRMCGLSGGLPSTPLPSSPAVSMKFLWRSDQEPATCSFIPLADRPGVWRLSTSLPAHVRVLAVIVAVCRFENSDDLTSRNVHPDWSSRPQTAVAEETGRVIRGDGSPTKLAAKAASGSTEHRGDTVNLVVAGNLPWSARVIRSKPKDPQEDVPPLPLLFTAFDAPDHAVAHEARLMLSSSDLVIDLFPGCMSPVHRLEVRPLPLNQLCRLGSVESAVLIGSHPHSLRMANSVADRPGEYLVNLANAEVREHLDHPDSVICLQLVELDGEVQS
jgi:hypothetical protein